MKKKIIIVIILVLIIVGIGVVIVLNYKNAIKKRNQKRYAEIKEDIQSDIAAYVRLTSHYCNPSRGENSGVAVYTDETLIYQRGMDKELLLDVDGESYCKVRVEVRCVDENEFAWDTYLKCKDYEDENYSNWETRK